MFRHSDIRTKLKQEIPVVELRGGGLGGLAPLVQALPQTPIIGLRSALAIKPPLKTF